LVSKISANFIIVNLGRCQRDSVVKELDEFGVRASVVEYASAEIIKPSGLV
jgi:hypothetical protein